MAGGGARGPCDGVEWWVGSIVVRRWGRDWERPGGRCSRVGMARCSRVGRSRVGMTMVISLSSKRIRQRGERKRTGTIAVTMRAM